MVAQRRDDAAFSAENAEGRDELKRLVDDLPASEIPAAKRMLGYLRDVSRDPSGLHGNPRVRYAAEHAPIDDEPVTDEDIAALEQSRAEVERGDVVSLDDLKHELRL